MWQFAPPLAHGSPRPASAQTKQRCCRANGMGMAGCLAARRRRRPGGDRRKRNHPAIPGTLGAEGWGIWTWAFDAGPGTHQPGRRHRSRRGCFSISAATRRFFLAFLPGRADTRRENVLEAVTQVTPPNSKISALRTLRFSCRSVGEDSIARCEGGERCAR